SLAKRKTVYVCQECGYESIRWMGKCTNCNNWNTFVEEIKQKKGARKSTTQTSPSVKPMKVNEIEYEKEYRLLTHMQELNRVLGGGIVPGSLVLIGGDPGIGKSTLLLQTSAQIAKKHRVLYVSGEESLQQTKLRANRIGVKAEDLYILAETNIHHILHYIDSV